MMAGMGQMTVPGAIDSPDECEALVTDARGLLERGDASRLRTVAAMPCSAAGGVCNPVSAGTGAAEAKSSSEIRLRP